MPGKHKLEEGERTNRMGRMIRRKRYVRQDFIMQVRLVCLGQEYININKDPRLSSYTDDYNFNQSYSLA